MVRKMWNSTCMEHLEAKSTAFEPGETKNTDTEQMPAARAACSRPSYSLVSLGS